MWRWVVYGYTCRLAFVLGTVLADDGGSVWSVDGWGG